MNPVSIAVGNRRLLKLADFLETVPRKRFEFRRWIDGRDWSGDPHECGTAACAMGHAVTMPAFRRLGLRAGRHSFSGPSVMLGRSHGAGAAARLFGITIDEAVDLFARGAMDKETPVRVARAIRRFVKERSR